MWLFIVVMATRYHCVTRYVIALRYALFVISLGRCMFSLVLDRESDHQFLAFDLLCDRSGAFVCAVPPASLLLTSPHLSSPLLSLLFSVNYSSNDAGSCFIFHNRSSTITRKSCGRIGEFRTVTKDPTNTS